MGSHLASTAGAFGTGTGALHPFAPKLAPSREMLQVGGLEQRRHSPRDQSSSHQDSVGLGAALGRGSIWLHTTTHGQDGFASVTHHIHPWPCTSACFVHHGYRGFERRLLAGDFLGS